MNGAPDRRDAKQFHGGHGPQVRGPLRAVRGTARRVPFALLRARHGRRRRRRFVEPREDDDTTHAGEILLGVVVRCSASLEYFCLQRRVLENETVGNSRDEHTHIGVANCFWFRKQTTGPPPASVPVFEDTKKVPEGGASNEPGRRSIILPKLLAESTPVCALAAASLLLLSTRRMSRSLSWYAG